MQDKQKSEGPSIINSSMTPHQKARHRSPILKGLESIYQIIGSERVNSSDKQASILLQKHGHWGTNKGSHFLYSNKGHKRIKFRRTNLFDSWH